LILTPNSPLHRLVGQRLSILLLLGLLACSEDSVPELVPGSVPISEAMLLANGDTTQLVDRSTPVTVVLAGAKECELCMRNLPIITDLRRRYPPGVVRLVVVLMDGSESRAGVRALADSLSEIHVVHDPKKRVMGMLDLLGIPRMFVFDSTGKQVAMFPGVTDSHANDILRTVDSLLKSR
jgi:hypothetical protein